MQEYSVLRTGYNSKLVLFRRGHDDKHFNKCLLRENSQPHLVETTPRLQLTLQGVQIVDLCVWTSAGTEWSAGCRNIHIATQAANMSVSLAVYQYIHAVNTQRSGAESSFASWNVAQPICIRLPGIPMDTLNSPPFNWETCSLGVGVKTTVNRHYAGRRCRRNKRRWITDNF